MSMVTSCPTCATTFRVQQEHLTARQGKVRCGKCDEVFDAYKTLASYPDEPLPETTPAAAPRGADGAERAPVQTTLDIDPAIGPALAAAGAGSTPRDPRSARRLRVAIVALSIALLLQLVYGLRVPLATGMPSLRPALEQLCAIAGCTVPLPKRSDALSIESSDLQADPKQPGVVVLTASLRNRGATAVQLPALELTLTNALDQPIGRRIFLPQDYVGGTAEAGLRAAGEVNVRIELAIGELKAQGYRLFLFYL